MAGGGQEEILPFESIAARVKRRKNLLFLNVENRYMNRVKLKLPQNHPNHWCPGRQYKNPLKR